MERRKITPNELKRKKKHLIHEILKPSKTAPPLLKNPWIKGAVVIGTIYGILFISKYIINEYAEVIMASKKLRDAYKL